MSDIPSFTSQKLIKILKKRGFVLDRVKGSHHIYYHPGLKRRVIVPLHKRDLPKGTFYEILKQAGIDKSDLKKGN
jgi:predicted RNA binding protein YcfA (HicA-like mRNA interferase family)